MVALSHGSRWAEGDAVLRMGGRWTCQAQTGKGGSGEGGAGREGGDGVGVEGRECGRKTPDPRFRRTFHLHRI